MDSLPPAEPIPGAHLTVARWGFRHHGIYAGGARVIHYAGPAWLWRRPRVVESSLEIFTRGRPWQQDHSVTPRFDAPTLLARARSRLGEQRYRLISNNCEHFTAWCISGESRSRQVERWLQRLGWRGPAPLPEPA
jgi:hypothetical protein